MKFVDFGAFQKITKMLSHDKILLRMFSRAFYDTSCTGTRTHNVALRGLDEFHHAIKSLDTIYDKLVLSIGVD